MKIRYAGATHVGQVRDHNEDQYSIRPEQDLMVVCDGMGGHAAGEVAARIAVETIGDLFADQDLELFNKRTFAYPEELTPQGRLLAGTVAVANQRVLYHSRLNPNLAGMGTTTVACHFHDGVMSVCHVGDSRAYLIRDGNIRRITVDHSWVNELMEKHHLSEEESKSYVNSNVITRALGTKPGVMVDVSEIVFKTGDLVLLCSDGLSGMVSDSQLLGAVEASKDDPQRLVAELIGMANDAGGADNITVCVGKVDDQSQVDNFQEIRRVTIGWEEERELAEIDRIIDSRYGEGAVADKSLSDSDTDPTAIEVKKKSSRLLTTILVAAIVLMALILAWFLDLF